jgi:ubiquinone/menaquinone biosynthesis C-methylase UbiE
MSIKTEPNRFNMIAKKAFAPVYPYLAEQIKNKFGITEGICVDVGSGPGSMAIAIARITNLKVFSLDIQPEMTTLAIENIAEARMENRIQAVTADVCCMPFDNGSVDLIISRGSIFFWDDRIAAFHEINRLLKPGAVAYVGGGMGNEQIRTQVAEFLDKNKEFKEVEDCWKKMQERGTGKLDPAVIGRELQLAGVTGKTVKENGGIWVEIHKGDH